MGGYLEFHDDYCCTRIADVVESVDRSHKPECNTNTELVCGQWRDACVVCGTGVDKLHVQQYGVQPEQCGRNVGDDGQPVKPDDVLLAGQCDKRK